MKPAIVLLWALAAVAPLTVFAQDVNKGQKGQQKTDKAPASVLENVENLADTAQRATTIGFNRFVLQIDDFFEDTDTQEDINRSWARLRVDGVKPADEDWEVKARVKARVVLPQAEKRLRLLLSTEDADVNGGTGARGLDISNDDQNVAFALRFVRSLSDKLQLKFDVGARMRERKGQVFGRISASNSVSLGGLWEQQISNNFYLYSASGYQNRFKLDIRRPLNEAANVFFRSSTTLEGRKGIGGASISETLGLYADISARTAIALEGLYSFVTSKDDELDTHFLGSEYRIRFRQNVWRPWFYYEVWPTVSFPASTDYQREYGGLLRVEVLFGQY